MLKLKFSKFKNILLLVRYVNLVAFVSMILSIHNFHEKGRDAIGSYVNYSIFHMSEAHLKKKSSSTTKPKVGRLKNKRKRHSQIPRVHIENCCRVCKLKLSKLTQKKCTKTRLKWLIWLSIILFTVSHMIRHGRLKP